MTANRSVAHRLGRVLETVTRQSARLTGTPEYGSWLLGRPEESQGRRRVRIQVILTFFILFINILGIAVSLLLNGVAIPVPSVFTDAPAWLTWGVVPTYMVVALIFGTTWITSRTVGSLRWAIEERPPTREDQRNVFLAPWRVAKKLLLLWGIGTVLLTVLYGMQDPAFIPRFLLAVGFPGIVVATACYMVTEFALRPIAAQALEAGRPPRRLAHGVMGRTMTVWLLSSGVPVLGILLLAVFTLALRNLTATQFAVAVMIIAVIALAFGLTLMWLLSWLIATPVRVVRSALKHVEEGDLDCSLVVFDGTELGELQRGFNKMVHGLKERERLRDIFGRHVGREVAAEAEKQRPKLGGEERHVAVIFVDIIGSTKLVTSKRATDVVGLLNRFFAVVVEEVDRHHGFVNKFEGDGALAVFGAPVRLENPEDSALAAARAIARRIHEEVPEFDAGIGVAAGEAVAGNVGARERFEYTVIGEPVNEAARLCELAKETPGHVLASSDAVSGASETECAHWRLGDEVTLRGHDEPTRLALPA
ncbi:putative adenylate/guanylate cyclase [Mycolicibacterium flavescens]|uniref:adenylate/guanylate cyclase domain-containing protein n=1 Tax=Mycobacterium neumannii TaxID=2048551 RepID=UPI000B941849|nr:adenylate/guanylate cyclase domain-containing protein [Mycobacterium neumannii]VEG39465.1 putative adenylate/guanylate cyclase [Mycolicibacterium flavescens]